MRKIFMCLGGVIISASAAQAAEIDACTTFADIPPGPNNQLLCEKEKQHSEELGLPPTDEQTVLTLDNLYEIKWSLHSMQRFKNSHDAYVYRVYIERE